MLRQCSVDPFLSLGQSSLPNGRLTHLVHHTCSACRCVGLPWPRFSISSYMVALRAVFCETMRCQVALGDLEAPRQWWPLLLEWGMPLRGLFKDRSGSSCLAKRVWCALKFCDRLRSPGFVRWPSSKLRRKVDTVLVRDDVLVGMQLHSQPRPGAPHRTHIASGVCQWPLAWVLVADLLSEAAQRHVERPSSGPYPRCVPVIVNFERVVHVGYV